MWQVCSHSVGPAAVILGFTVTTLWYFKASAPIVMKFSGLKEKKKITKKKERERENAPEQAQALKNANPVLPIKTIKVCVIVF